MIRYNHKQDIEDLIRIFLRQNGLEKGYLEFQVLECWKNYMGPMINARTTDLFIRDKTIFVKLSSAPLKQELAMAKTKILEQLMTEVPDAQIEDIRFI
ncbi:MAG: DUF721 domain-containing protein [Flavobacteriales bacterium]